MPGSDALREFLQGLLAEYGEDRELTEDMPLVSSGLLDSLAILKIVLFLEQNHGVDFSEDGIVADQFDTLASIRGLAAKGA